jgi:hypothetical protein
MSSDIAIFRETIKYHEGRKDWFRAKSRVYSASMSKLERRIKSGPNETISRRLGIVRRKYLLNLQKSRYHLDRAVFWQTILVHETSGTELDNRDLPSLDLHPSINDFLEEAHIAS